MPRGSRQRQPVSQMAPVPAVEPSPPAVQAPPEALPVALPAVCCGNCRWWREDIEANRYDAGHCRRYPPQVPDSRRITSVGPLMLSGLTARSDFCGEHQPSV